MGHENSTHSSQSGDFLFLSQEACLSFKKFRKYDMRLNDNHSNLALIWFDAITKNSIDNLQKYIANMEALLQNRGDNYDKNCL